MSHLVAHKLRGFLHIHKFPFESSLQRLVMNQLSIETTLIYNRQYMQSTKHKQNGTFQLTSTHDEQTHTITNNLHKVDESGIEDELDSLQNTTHIN